MQETRHRKGAISRRWRTLLVMIGGLSGFALIGAIYQTISTISDREKYPPPGQMVNVGGHRLHLNVMGRDRGGPTVILESGLGLPSVEWAWVQPEVAKFAQVVAYDRAGLGWSEAGPEPRDARRIATELHTALQEAGIDGPYVLVGHSNGGLYVRTFADQYPDEIVGMVLVDSAHPDQYDRSNTKQRSLLISKVLFVTLDVMARLGVLRVIDLTPTFFPGLPPHQEDEMRAFVADGLWAGTFAEFLVLKDRTDPQVRQTGNLEDMPLAVLTASASVNEDAVWGDLQDELTTLSTNSAHFTVEDAEHGSIVLNRGHALVVARAVRQVVDAASTGRPVTPPDQSQQGSGV